MKKIFSLIVFLFATHISFAQNYQGRIANAHQKGLHEIILTPEVRSAMQNNVGFFRIYDAKKREVPYVVFKKNSEDLESKNLVILSKNAVPNVSTSVIIANENALQLNELTLQIANTEVDKKYHISGSNDGNEWFGLVNNQMAYNLNEVGKTSVEKTFSFPLNTYKFLKFDFIDKNSLPINVLGAKIMSSLKDFNIKEPLKNFTQKITTNPKTKQTRISISFNEPQVIDGIGFDILAPNYYLRNAKIIVKRTRINKKREEKYEEVVSYFELNSKFKNQFDIPEIFAEEISIEIENQDNQPLEIGNITILQKPFSVLADVNANETYSFKIDSLLKSPTYDLAQSGINFNLNYPALSIASFEKIKTADKTSTKNFWQTPLFMWVCIIIALLILGYFSLKMIKDMNQEQD